MSWPGTKPGQKALDLHNSYRESHGSPALEWSHLLSMEARKHAVALANGDTSTNPGLTYGENVFHIRRRLAQDDEDGIGALEDVSDLEGVERAVETWYEDKIDYDWSHDPASPNNSGMNFSQLVWKSTTKMGLGLGRSKQRDEDGKLLSVLVVVALYDPPGNVRGQFRDNVGLKNFSKSTGVAPKSSRSPSPPSVTPTIKIPKSVTVKPVPPPKPKSKPNLVSNPPEIRRTPEKTEEKKYNFNMDNDKNRNLTTNFNSLSLDSSVSEPVRGHKTLPVSPAARLSSTASATLTKAVDLHNQYRRKHRASPLKLDPKLTADAQAYAESLAFNSDNQKLQPSTLELGRNVYRVSGGPVDENVAVKAAVSKWYGQSKEYNWSNPRLSDHAANLFCQLIWRASKSIGVGVVSNNEMTVVVAFYTPGPGPTPTDASYRENVRPPIF